MVKMDINTPLVTLKWLCRSVTFHKQRVLLRTQQESIYLWYLALNLSRIRSCVHSSPDSKVLPDLIFGS
jgi:hypothetical protein